MRGGFSVRARSERTSATSFRLLKLTGVFGSACNNQNKNMSWEKSLKVLNDEGIGGNLTYLHSRTSSVTTSWGVDWNETYIARDIMQNFFDANRNRLSEIRVVV